MKKFYPVLIACCLWVYTGYTQAVRLPVSAACQQLKAYSQQPDVFSFTANQAALTGIHQLSAGVFGEKRFLLQDLSAFQAAAVLPTKSGNFGTSLHYFGNANYNEMQAALAYGKQLGEKVAAGVQFNYYTFQTAGYGRAASVNVEAGLLFRFTDQVRGGVHVYNPSRSKLGKYAEENLPVAVSMGLGYDASEHVFVTATLEKMENRPLNVQAGLEYRFDEKLLARTGMTTATNQYFFSAGVQLKDFRLEAIATVHPQLGITPGILLLFKNFDNQ